MLGPSYETPAEIAMLERMGADVVCMSTAAEASLASSIGLPAVGISCVTNRAAGKSSVPLSHAEVTAAVQAGAPALRSLLERADPRVGVGRNEGRRAHTGGMRTGGGEWAVWPTSQRAVTPLDAPPSNERAGGQTRPLASARSHEPRNAQPPFVPQRTVTRRIRSPGMIRSTTSIPEVTTPNAV